MLTSRHTAAAPRASSRRSAASTTATSPGYKRSSRSTPSTRCTRTCSRGVEAAPSSSESRPGRRPARRAHILLDFAFDGLLGRESDQAGGGARAARGLARGRARRRARSAFARWRSRLANEPDGDRRAAIEGRLRGDRDGSSNPLHLEMLEAARATCRELGWRGYARRCARSCGASTSRRSARKTQAFLDATSDGYAAPSRPPLSSTSSACRRSGSCVRSDLPRFFRGGDLDAGFDGGADDPRASPRRSAASESISPTQRT